MLWKITAEHFYRQYTFRRYISNWRNASVHNRKHVRAIQTREQRVMRKILRSWNELVRKRKQEYKAYSKILIEKLRDHFQFWRRQAQLSDQNNHAFESAAYRSDYKIKKQLFIKWKRLALQQRGLSTIIRHLRTAYQRRFAIECLRRWKITTKYQRHIRRSYRYYKLRYYHTLKESMFKTWHQSLVYSRALVALNQIKKRNILRKWVEATQNGFKERENDMLKQAKQRLAILETKVNCKYNNVINGLEKIFWFMEATIRTRTNSSSKKVFVRQVVSVISITSAS
jgi:transposase